MKLRFKHQQFQTDAAKSVVEVFAGQPYSRTDWNEDSVAQNFPIQLRDEEILANLQRVQISNRLEPSKKLEKIDGSYNLTIEMETGVGKTYTYIKTMYALNRKYGWSKFIIVVPSVAIREGVFKTFQVTSEHFAEEYESKIHFFIYNSMKLDDLEYFARNPNIQAMIINSQAFNSKGKDARRIRMELDEFQSQKPIELVASTNPILIIDEPQSVEGTKTKEGLRDFHPLLTLRYSATHREVFNMIYRLDALDAYNKHLVKKIRVVGIKTIGETSSDGFIYLERINLSRGNPTATIHFDSKTASGVSRKIQTVRVGFDLFENSGNLEEYRDNFVLKSIDGRENSIEFQNGTKIFAGDLIGIKSEEQIRRIQIRETIKAHLERESQLFNRGIKVLSLFFIDEVTHYKTYDSLGNQQDGDFARWFEEEYSNAIREIQPDFFNESYRKYLETIPVEKTHAGYFSIDNKGKITNGKISSRGEKISEDIDAYDLIMRNKELLLDQDPNRSPVRFIFSHSALREGWDNPNVFQICTLKQSSSEIRKRQEVGRGLRLCVNQSGERMDEDLIGHEVHDINVLTIIASESYDEFASKLQREIADAVSDRPRKIDQKFFVGKKLPDRPPIDETQSTKIYNSMIRHDYIDDAGSLTEKYFEDKQAGNLEFTEEFSDCKESIVEILDTSYQPRRMEIENSRNQNVDAKFNSDRFENSEFQNLWKKINLKTIYEVDFESEDLIRKIVSDLNINLQIARTIFRVETGQLRDQTSKEELKSGESFEKKSSDTPRDITLAESESSYDPIGKIMEETGLNRKTIAKILGGIDESTLSRFKLNPDEFIAIASNRINSIKSDALIEYIRYRATGEIYSAEIFSSANISGTLNHNALETQKNLYDYLVYDSSVERKFAEELESDKSVRVYAKLPRGFFIPTPVGRYNPDWAIVFNRAGVEEIYFIAETKGSTDSNQLRLVEESKIHCAREHFKSISSDSIRYDVVHSFDDLLKKIFA